MLQEAVSPDIDKRSSPDQVQKQTNRERALARHHRLKSTTEYQQQRQANDKKRRTHTCPNALPCRACERNKKNRKYPDAPRRTFPPYKKMSRLYWRIAVGLLVDRDGWACYLCHESMTWETVTIDHLIPQCIDPLNHHPANLRLAHRSCNASKSASILPQAILTSLKRKKRQEKPVKNQLFLPLT